MVRTYEVSLQKLPTSKRDVQIPAAKERMSARAIDKEVRRDEPIKYLISQKFSISLDS